MVLLNVHVHTDTHAHVNTPNKNPSFYTQKQTHKKRGKQIVHREADKKKQLLNFSSTRDLLAEKG